MTAADALLVRRVWDAIERGDAAEALAGMSPDVRWHGVGMADGPGACHGRDAVGRFLHDARADGRRARLLDLREARGGLVVAVVRTASRDDQGSHGELITVRDRRVASLVVYPTVGDALRAAGLGPGRLGRMAARLRAPVTALDGQLARPHGRVGRVVAAALNLTNRRLNRAAVDALQLVPGERLLDVGVGGAVGTRLALARGARVVAIDPSADVVDAVHRRLPSSAEAHVGSAADPGVAPASVDAGLTVNSIYFWPSVQAGLAGIRSVLVDGGRLAVGAEAAALRRHARLHVDLPATPAELAQCLAANGFDAVTVRAAGRGRTVILATKRPEVATVQAP